MHLEKRWRESIKGFNHSLSSSSASSKMMRWVEAPPSHFSALDRQREGQQQQISCSMYDDAHDIGDIVPFPNSMQSLYGAHDQERSGNGGNCIHEQIGSHGNRWPNLTREVETSIREQSNNLRKRKLENISNQKVGCGSTGEDGLKDKRAKEGIERGRGAAVRDIAQANNKKEVLGDASKEKAKPPKTDYIHVRARRGQATDSHSLAERVRRERISERMRYLQELVPGCSTITGKAGILDQIINYVQSLQRQVEFLSMKLTAVNPRLDFNIDNFFNREINLACNSGVLPTIDMSFEQLDPSYIQFNCLHPTTACCGVDMAMGSSDIVPHRTISLPASMPETILDSSLNVHGSSSSPWNSGLQNLHGVEFHQGRGPSFPFQLLQGDILTHNLETEM